MKKKKRYDKSKFKYRNKDAENGDLYFNYELRWSKKFPFLERSFIEYKLTEDFWVD